MASTSCPICGDEADADEIDPHGHFSEDEDEDDDVIVHLLILRSRKDTTACGADPEDGASTSESDVNCFACRAAI